MKNSAEVKFYTNYSVNRKLGVKFIITGILMWKNKRIVIIIVSGRVNMDEKIYRRTR